MEESLYNFFQVQMKAFQKDINNDVSLVAYFSMLSVLGDCKSAFLAKMHKDIGWMQKSGITMK